ncbi:PREDICTED: disease resistance protein RPS4-like [Camelina sativa]|uniref:Disease resistance protein RPS4-like n=1 Tax=Camelina sativa TaxID=90675 RepID=A0ABM0XR45_CAMSA|nr:PREDICTED: disease resistance protein RPS4-like [Camelina sativa]
MAVFSSTQSHQLFLNFRGEELRYSFVSHLIDALERNGINIFVDRYELRGKDLKNLFVRLQESKIALAIFSTRYAESPWCMDELVTMKKLADQGKLLVIPIFYNVEPEDIRKQTGEFGEKFWTLAKGSTGDEIKKWKEALECISDKMGLSLGGKSYEADFIKEIVKEVQRVIAAIGTEDEVNHFGGKNKKNRKCNFPRELTVFKRIKTKKIKF